MGEGAWGRPSRGDAQTVQDQGGGRAVSSGGSLTGGDGLGISSPEVLTIGSSQRGSSTGESSTESCGSQDTRAGERGGGSVGSLRCWRILVMTGGSEMKARMTIAAEQRGHFRA